MGWRYVMYTSGAMVFVMSIARITVIRLKETPKYLLGEGKDEELVEHLQNLAAKYNRPCSLTKQMLEDCGTIRSAHGKSRFSVSEVLVHFRGLFATKSIGLSTVLIWLSWTLIGLCYPLFYVFLPTYLQTRGAQFGVVSTYDSWRNYALVNISGIPVSPALSLSRDTLRSFMLLISSRAPCSQDIWRTLSSSDASTRWSLEL